MMKNGDKIRFNGVEGYAVTTKGKEYRVFLVEADNASYIGDDGHRYVWNFRKFPTHFTVVSSSKPSQAPVVHEGDMIEFLGTEGHRVRYRDTTVGTRYEVYSIGYSEFGEVESVRYIDDADDEVNWNIRFENEWNHFKVHSNGQGAKGIYKDDVIRTRPTKLDLESMMDLALDLEDMAWAQDIYNQIQQLEGEHA